MSSRKRSRGLEMLRASGVRPDLSAIKETHNEGASTPEVPPGAGQPSSTPLSQQAKSPVGAGSKAATLPEYLRGILRIWEAMLTAKAMLNRRRERITLKSLKPFVESYSNKQFKVEHVQQIKALYPEAFTWQYIKAPISKEDRQLEYQLLLRFERATASGASSGRDSGTAPARVSDADEKTEFEARLVAFDQQQQAEQQGHAQEPASASKARLDGKIQAVPFPDLVMSSPSGSGSSHPRPAPLQISILPLADLPAKEGCVVIPASPGMASPATSRRSGLSGGGSGTPSRSTAAQGAFNAAAQAAGTPSSSLNPHDGMENAAKRRHLMADGSAAVEPSPFAPARLPHGNSGLTISPNSSAGAPSGSNASGGVGGAAYQRGGSFNMSRAPSGAVSGGLPSRQGSGSSGLHPTGLPPTGLPPTPSSARRNPLLARLMSADALVLLDKSEAARMGSPSVRARRQQMQAAVQLPSAFDIIRVIFGVRGSCLRAKDEVVAAMRDKSAQRGGLGLAEAQMQVEMLAREVPEYLRIESQTPLRDAGALAEQQRAGPRLMVRIERSADLDAVRRSLTALAARALEQQQQDVDPA